MTYLEIKEEIKSVSEQIAECRKTVDYHENTDLSLRETLDRLTNVHKLKIEELIELQRSRHNEEIAKDFVDKIEECINAKSKLKLNYDKNLEKINKTDYAKKFSGEFSIENEENTCNEIKDSIKNFYGENFTESLKNSKLPKRKLDVNSITSNLHLKSKVMNKSRNLTEVVSKLSGGINYNQGDNVQLVIAGSLSTVVVIASFVAYPITLALIVGSMVYNSYKSKFFLDCNAVCDSFDKNIKGVKLNLDKKIKEQKEENVKNLNSSYNSKLEELSTFITQLENKRDLEVEKGKDRFTPDTNYLEESNREERVSIEERFQSNKANLGSSKKILMELVDKLNTLKDSLDETVNYLVTEYLPKELKPNQYLPNDFLIDLKGTEPDIFPLQKSSCLFVYEDSKQAYNFIKIMFYQILLRMDPTLFKFTIIDLVGVERDLSYYEDRDAKSSISPVLSTITNRKEIDPFLSACNEEIRRRVKLTRNNTDIEDYNKFMLEQDCPMETYNFIINKDPDLSKLLSDDNRSIINNGGKTGYFEYLFIDIDSFNKSNSQILSPLLDSKIPINSFSVTTTVKRKAKMFYASMLED